ncbi:MAG: trypsin-like peptidase domain-containing protein [Holosporales bacterium]|jgi:serine protease Do|nr:trypsin-like peptidase domain-containing protein [Holosporales bacterium]
MRVYRVLLCLLLVAGTWEVIRSDVLGILKGVTAIKQDTTEHGSSDVDVQASGDADVTRKEEEIKTLPQKAEKPALHPIDFEDGFAKVAKGAMSSVVGVAVAVIEKSSHLDGSPGIFRSPFDDLFREFFGGEFPDFPQRREKPRRANALGSGFIIKVTPEWAYIVTNNHVVEKASKVVITLSDKTELPAEIYATDPRTDIAVLKVSLVDKELQNKVNPLEWGNSDAIEEGNFVIAIGNPFGLGSTVTHGIVSAKSRNVQLGRTSMSMIEDFIQHSAPINMGNSGGCLLNIQGEVIGINNAIFSTSGGNIGIGFAIPSNVARMTVEQLIKHKRTYRGWLGAEVHQVNGEQATSIKIPDSTPDKSKIYGAFVSKVVPGGPAEKAGVKVNDVIIEVGGKKISEKNSLQVAIGTAAIGSNIKVIVWRQKSNGNWGEVALSVKIGDFESASEGGNLDAKDKDGKNGDAKSEATVDTLGVTVANLPEQYKSRYGSDVNVIVVSVDESKSNSFYGSLFREGDAIIIADNKKVTSVSQFVKIMDNVAKRDDKKPVPFVIERGGSRMIIATTLYFEEPSEKKAG